MTVTWSDIDVTWEVTVTSNDMAICSSLQSDRHFEKMKIEKWCQNDVKLPKMQKISKKIFLKILLVTVT